MNTRKGSKSIALALCVQVIILLGLVSCHSPTLGDIPDTEIVYVASEGKPGHDYLDYLGFVNADGSGLGTQEMGGYIRYPAWYQDTVFFREGMGAQASKLSAWTSGKPKLTCKMEAQYPVNSIGGQLLQEYTGLIINQNGFRIVLYDVDQCEVKKIYVEVPEIVGHIDNWLLGASLSPDKRSLLYTYQTGQGCDADYSIRKMDLETGNTVEIGKGQYPVWSPDGEKIAFFGLDGIDVMNADGSQRQNLLLLFDTKNSSCPSVLRLSWSPDGKYIAYNRYEDAKARPNLYLLEIATGKEELIATGAMDPFWRQK
ncbi:MAG: TolB family protein [Chloroflexota bacterium]